MILKDLKLFKNDKAQLSVGLVLDYHSKDLKKIMDMSNDIEINETHLVKVFYSLLCALKFLHSANILHRDLKPSNLLFKSDCKIAVCDFGLSRTLHLNKTINDIKKINNFQEENIAKDLLLDRPDRKSR